MSPKPRPKPKPIVAVFFAFAFAYFFSALLRAVTATLAPVFSTELGLQAGDLGLLAGAYYFGFAALQLPLGRALDRFGPRRTLLTLLALATLGCAAFAQANGLAALIGSRVLIGAGMAAGLMAPLTCYRRILSPMAQLRANSWMLMTGSLGMVASTLPVQWLLPQLGWRGLFWALAVMLLLAMAMVAGLAPADELVSASAAPEAPSAQVAITAKAAKPATPSTTSPGSYRTIVRHPLFVRLAPLGFFVYGGLIAVQSLWAGPWLTRVAGGTAQQAAQGLFVINLAMLAAFLIWGAVMPRLAARGVAPLTLIGWGSAPVLLLLAANIALGADAGAAHWAAWCVACTFVAVSQPAVGASFPSAVAGRALSAFNLVIFSGVFCVQWGIGLLIDALRAAGLAEAMAFRAAFAFFWLLCAGAYIWFLRVGRQGADNPG